MTTEPFMQSIGSDHWNGSLDSNGTINKSSAPKGDSQGVLFQRMMEGANTQATQAMAAVAPEEMIRKLEQSKRQNDIRKLVARRKAEKKNLRRLKQKGQFSGSSGNLPSKDLNLAKSLKQIFGKFCGLVVNSERDLMRLERHLSSMTKNDQSWHPAQLYLVQVRVAHLSQKLEFFTSLTNKALESSKQVMNTQI